MSDQARRSRVGQVTPAPPDADARRRIANDLDHTLFIEAGAGAGKTTSLVERVVSLVENGVAITSIAAITFTEKAAAELRHRLRASLSTSRSDAAAAALADLDHAPIGTLHAFARRILNEYPIEAQLPPGFAVLDALESDIAFDEDWVDHLDGLLAEAEPPGGPTAGGGELVDLFGWDGLRVDVHLAQIADAFRWNWDLVEERVDLDPPAELVVDLATVSTLTTGILATPTPPDDRQSTVAGELRVAIDALTAADGLYDTAVALTDLRRPIGGKRPVGSKTKWRHHGGDSALEALRELQASLVAEIDRLHTAIRTHRKRVAGVVCGRFVLDGAERRAAAGTLEFHDLLVRARRLLVTQPAVRARLHRTYTRLLLDEFQDTDPIQLEIAVRITAAPDDPAQADDWTALRPLPGRLFVVGDPKQSIYRFRRADIAQYLRTPTQVDADVEHLGANFRSTRAVIDYSNDLFGELIRFSPDTQPAFLALQPCRDPRLLDHGTVTVLGADVHADLAGQTYTGELGPADELRRREALDVVGAVTAALHDRWPVADTAPGNEGTLRPCRPGDICILLPARLSLPALEAALQAAGVPYRAENSSIVYATTEVRDLLLAVRAADDPTDELALVESLRSPLYGCSDVDLFEWRAAGGTWSLFRPPPEGMEGHPVADGIAHLLSVHRRVTTTGVADLLAAVVEERRIFDLALDGSDAPDVWHRLRFVVDQARAWADAGGRGVRRYLAWAYRQASEGQVAESILPDEERDAIRLMTVHAAKGLEFPITIVSGLTTDPRPRRGVEVTWAGGGWQLTGQGDDGSFAEIAPIDELMSDAERRRLLYVATTRAVDHLVLSLHRKTSDDKVREKNPERLTSAELLWRSGAADRAGATRASFTPVVVHTGAPATADTDTDRNAWAHELQATHERAGRRRAVAATRLADEVIAASADPSDDPALDKQPVNIDLPPWQRGRYGTSIGRAVHGTLQFCDMDQGRDIDTLARAQCAAEGILSLSDRVAALARSAIGAPIIRTVVAGAPHWRELFVAAPIGDRVLEGYVDLLVRTPEGLVIVDYKTDQWSGSAEIAARVERYRIQLAAYGAALEVVLGEPVQGGLLVRCRPGEVAEQIEIPRWGDALSQVLEIVA